MATKADFNTDEWRQLLQAPGLTSLVVVAASPSGPMGVIKEMFAAGRLLADTQGQKGKNALVDAIMTDLSSAEGRGQAQPKLSGKSADEVRTGALDGLRLVADLVDRKAPAEADGFKTWLLSLSNRVAEAAKEGGFLGIGGTRVSEQEQDALNATATALGISTKA